MTNLIYCLLLFCVCGENTEVNIQKKQVSEIFIAWNKATVKSLQCQIDLTTDQYQKSLYINRLDALKSYWAVNNVDLINENSIRYKFLNENLRSWEKDFYIIEANDGGEKISLITYVIFPLKKDSSKILKYKYENKKWSKIEEYTVNSNFKFDKENYITKFGEGKNENDIIVTYIEHDTVVNSDFFLFLTMKNLELLKQ